MPALKAEPHHAQSVAQALKDKGFKHLRTRIHGSLLIIESGLKDHPDPRARLRRDTIHLWTLEMATHSGRWEKTPFRAQLHELLELLIETFGWTLTPLDNPARTTDPEN